MLQIALRDGFRNDAVTISIDGKEVYRKSGVTTDLSSSAADALEVPVDGPTCRLEVAVARGPRHAEQVQVRETPFVDVRLLEGRLQFDKSGERIPMM